MQFRDKISQIFWFPSSGPFLFSLRGISSSRSPWTQSNDSFLERTTSSARMNDWFSTVLDQTQGLTARNSNDNHKVQSETADDAPSAATRRIGRNINVVDYSPFAPLYKNMTSSTKPEVHNVLHCLQRRSEPAMGTSNTYRKFGKI